MKLETRPVAKTGLRIRRPVAEVYEAFVNPDIITKFWFSRSSGPLEEGKTVQWYWDMYNISADVVVKSLVPNERVVLEWSSENVAPTSIEWTFESRPDDHTFVTIVNEGFSGNADEMVAAALDSVTGFTLVIAAAKAFLEHGVELNVVADKI